AKTGSTHLVRAQKLLDDLFKPRIFLRRILLVPSVTQFSRGKVKQRQVDLRAAHIPSQNHRSLSNAPRPCPSAAGNKAAASLSRIRVSIPLAGHISWLGSRSGSRGPVKTSFTSSALFCPPIKKKTELPWLITGHVSVMRHVS